MKSITTTGGNLYQLAALYLNAADQWDRIAAANVAVLAPNGGVPDPIITGTVTLQIPDIDPNAGGGIYAA